MTTPVQEIFGNKLRVRVCGICIHHGQILLVNHDGLDTPHFWAPPGGGIQTGESAHEALVREFKEETGLTIEVRDFLFACEFIQLPLHAVELFFQVSVTGGNLKTGQDPELGNRQIIKDVCFFDDVQIRSIPLAHLHGIFKEAADIAQIGRLRGYFKL
jgi:8-oxo-dGTP diphosphatase